MKTVFFLFEIELNINELILIFILCLYILRLLNIINEYIVRNTHVNPMKEA